MRALGWAGRARPGLAKDPLSLETTDATYDVAQVVLAQVHGKEAVEAGVGRSIPCIAGYPGATVLVTGVGYPASRWHGIDESLDLAMWERWCLAEALLLDGVRSESQVRGQRREELPRSA